jgi:hypothetical protein
MCVIFCAPLCLLYVHVCICFCNNFHTYTIVARAAEHRVFIFALKSYSEAATSEGRGRTRRGGRLPSALSCVVRIRAQVRRVVRHRVRRGGRDVRVQVGARAAPVRRR